jgi:small-conductance mechanosensitive channel
MNRAAAATTATTTTPATRLAAAHQTTTTTLGRAVVTPDASSSDRGVIHQMFLDVGASPARAHTAQIYLAGPARVLVIVAIAFVLTRLVSRVSRRLVNGLRLVSPLVDATPRGSARVRTLAGAFTSVFRAVIWVVAFLEVLSQFDINLAPFVATATVVGAALGFGAQSLVKDFLSGILILAEDQYGVGDHISIGTGANVTVGTVESVNLRVTRLRGADGGILYVPNGDIRTVSNDTETDSQALVDVAVPLGTDLDAAGAAAEDAARLMAADAAWSDEFVSEPHFAGVQDASTSTGVTIRVMALTRPGQHLRMAREMRLRILERLRRDNLAWAPAGAEPVAQPAAGRARKAAGKATTSAPAETAGPAERAARRLARKATGVAHPGGRDRDDPGLPPGPESR